MVPIPEGSETHSGESSSLADYGSQQEELDQPGELTGTGGCHRPVDDEAGKLVTGACELSG